MKTVIEMARKSGFLIDGVQEFVFAPSSFHFTEELKHFAELVRADEREKYKWDVHSCGPTCTKAACVAMREAVEAEREACAKFADQYMRDCEGKSFGVGNAIRARSNT